MPNSKDTYNLKKYSDVKNLLKNYNKTLDDCSTKFK